MPSYKDAIKWLHDEDDVTMNREADMLSVAGSMVSDLWNRSAEKVAADVRKLDELEKKIKTDPPTDRLKVGDKVISVFRSDMGRKYKVVSVHDKSRTVKLSNGQIEVEWNLRKVD